MTKDQKIGIDPEVGVPSPSALANKFEVTVMLTTDFMVDERTIEACVLRALGTKEFWLTGQAQVYAKALPAATMMRRFSTVAPVVAPVLPGGVTAQMGPMVGAMSPPVEKQGGKT